MPWGLASVFLFGVAVGIAIGIALAISHRDRLDRDRARRLERSLRDRGYTDHIGRSR